MALASLFLMVGLSASPEVSESTQLAETTLATEAGSFGLQLSLSGDPYPSLLGAGMHYYVWDMLRVEANVGWAGAGVGMRLSIPEIDITPVLGIATAMTYVGGEWELGGYATLGIQLFGHNGWSLEGGLACAPGIFKGDFAECSSYLRLGVALWHTS